LTLAICGLTSPYLEWTFPKQLLDMVEFPQVDHDKNAKKVTQGRSLLYVVALFMMVLFAAASAMAQQTTGTPCSPSATTTIDGKYLPSPPAPFGGEINLSAE
jgi:hypothetical protein